MGPMFSAEFLAGPIGLDCILPLSSLSIPLGKHRCTEGRLSLSKVPWLPGRPRRVTGESGLWELPTRRVGAENDSRVISGR